METDPEDALAASTAVASCSSACGPFILPNGDLTAQGIYTALCKKGWAAVPVKAAAFEDILFFGKDLKRITHVAIAMAGGLMIEAGGGNSKCKTAATSTGMVRVRPISWRKDLVAVLRE